MSRIRKLKIKNLNIYNSDIKKNDIHENIYDKIKIDYKSIFDRNDPDSDSNIDSDNDISIPIPNDITDCKEYQKNDQKDYQTNDQKDDNKKHKKKIKVDIEIFDRIFNELNEIRKEINSLRNEMGNIQNHKIPVLQELKREVMNIDEKKIKLALELNGIYGDIMLIKSYYLNTNLKPIKKINTKHYEYWSSGKWNHDEYGKYIREIFSNNLISVYIKTNTLDNFDIDQFNENQKHIYELNDEKYQKELLKQIDRFI